MARIDFKNLGNQNNNAVNPKIAEANSGWEKSKMEITDALLELGRACYEANKDNESSEYASQVADIKAKYENEALWNKYRLSLNGQTVCDNCKSIITSDSLFCNRCGTSVAPADFSKILGSPFPAAPMPSAPMPMEPPKPRVCVTCGGELIEGALFCERCGTKIQQ